MANMGLGAAGGTSQRAATNQSNAFLSGLKSVDLAQQGYIDEQNIQESEAVERVGQEPDIDSKGKMGDNEVDNSEVLIDGIEIIDGKVGGKIPVDGFKILRKSSIKNPDANTITLGKYTNGPDSYIARAGNDSSVFDMGEQWGVVRQKYGLSNKEMFDYFNIPALDDAILSGKTIRFSHNPLDYDTGALPAEWDYIKNKLGLTDKNLIFEGGFWYVK